MSGSPILDARSIQKTLGARELLKSVDLSVHDGDRVGLVGQNGSGKSTLARYLAGVDQPDGGTIAVRGGATVGYLSQVPNFDPTETPLSVALGGLGAWADAYRRYQECTELIEAGKDLDRQLATQADLADEVERLGGWDREHEAEKMLKRLGVSRIREAIGTMSGGEVRRTALARLFVNPPTLAVLDEPTNHLDVATIEWMEEFLRKDFGGALILITHDRYILDRVVTRTAELHDGSLSVYQGGWSEYLTEKANRQAHDARTLANQKNTFRRELEWLRRQPKARTTKSKARIGTAEALGDQIRAHKGPRRLANLEVQTIRAGKRVLEIENLAIELGGRTLIEDLTLHLRSGERVGIVGPNGAGKTSFLRALLGQLAPSKGVVRPGQNTEFLYVDQRKDVLDEEKTVTENVSGGQPTVTVFGREMAVQSWLERFMFFGQDQRAPVGSLSGGERARVALAKTFLSPGNFLLLDEPTNDLDVMTLSALEAMLSESDVTSFVVTHDRYFLDRVATAILAFEGSGRVVKYEGNYSDYETLSRHARKDRSGRGGADRAKNVGAKKDGANSDKADSYGGRGDGKNKEEQEQGPHLWGAARIGKNRDRGGRSREAPEGT